MDNNFYEIGPGFLGFVATFVIAVALVLLYRSLTKHLRKVRHDEQVLTDQRRFAREATAQSAPTDAPSSGGTEHGKSGGDVVAHEADNGE